MKKTLLYAVLVLVLLPYILGPAGIVCDYNSPCNCGTNCHNGCESLNGYNTIDGCMDGPNYYYEHVEDITVTSLNRSYFKIGDTVQIDAYVDCDLDGDEMSYVYSNGSVGSEWKNIGDDYCEFDGLNHRYKNVVLDPVAGYHHIRVVIALNGATNMICGYYHDQAYSDTDDVTILVVSGEPDMTPPTVKDLAPSQGTEYLYESGLVINISANVSDDSLDSVYANVTWSNQEWKIVLSNNSGLFTGQFSGITSLGRYDITIVANDTSGNINNTETTYFTINMTGNITVNSPATSVIYVYGEIGLGYVISNDYDYDHTWYTLNSGDPIYVESFESASFNESGTSSESTQSNNLSQSFVFTNDVNTNKIAVKINGSGSAILEIRTDDNGNPGEEAASVNITNLSSDIEWHNLTLNQSVNFYSGSRYWLYIEKTTENHVCWQSGLDGYQLGNYSHNNSKDLMFYVYDIHRINYTIRPDKGTYDLQAYANDSSTMISSEIISFEVDNEPPEFGEFTLSHTQAVPNTFINVTIEVDDNVGLDEVYMFYRKDSGTWYNRTMDVYIDRYMSNLTPDSEGNWSVYVRAYDGSNNTDVTDTATVLVYYNYTWDISSQFNATGILINNNGTIGNLTIINYADFAFPFSVSSNFADLFFNGTNSTMLNISASSNATFAVTAAARAVPTVDHVVITVDNLNASANPSLLTNNFTLISYLSGAYLYADIVEYSSSVYQGDHILSLKARISNVGNETAHNVTAVWTLPSGWTSRSNLTKSLGNLSANGIEVEYFQISADVSSTADTGTKTLTIFANCSEGRSSTDSRTVTVSSTSSNDVIITNPTSPGSAGTNRIPTRVTENVILNEDQLTLTFPKIDVLRGQVFTITFNITNNHPSELRNLTFRVDGLLSKYYLISPSGLDSLTYRSNASINITFMLPMYITGKQTWELSVDSPQLDEEILHEFEVVIFEDLNQVNCLEEALQLIQELSNKGINTEKLDSLYKQGLQFYESRDYDELSSICETIKKNTQNANSLSREIKILGNVIASSASSELKESFELLLQSFNRGDFETAIGRLDQLKLAIEIKQTVDSNLLLDLLGYIKKHLLMFLLVTVLSPVFIGSFVYLHSMQYIDSRLKSISAEKKKLNSMIMNIQKEHYETKLMSSGLYLAYMEEYRKKYANLEKETIRLELKKMNKLRIDPSSERAKLTALLADLQRSYFEKKTIDLDTYESLYMDYQSRIAEIAEVQSGGAGKPLLKEEPSQEELLSQEGSPLPGESIAGNKENIILESGVFEPGISKKLDAKLEITEAIERLQGQAKGIYNEKRVDENEAFMLANGTKVYSLVELISELVRSDDSVFSHHVTTERNDFAEWIRRVFKDEGVAKLFENAKKKEDITGLMFYG